MRNLSLGPLADFVLVVAILALGQPVLVPVALAFYLAFVLTPPVDALERIGVPRGLSVTSVVAAALAAVAVFGTVLISQAADLGRQMQRYSAQMSEKLTRVRSDRFGVVEDLTKAINQLGKSLDPQVIRAEDVTPVQVVSGGFSTFERLEHALGPLLRPVGISVLVIVMAIFVLGHREDLRGRLIQLMGTQNVTVTTRTMAEAVKRVGHLLLTQAYINVGFGVVIAGGLYFIGVPYALLWGVLAGVLRFVPLLGAVIATLLPSLAAFAIFPGWREVLLTIGLFLVVDTLVANFLEPMVLGKRTGVSALALLISALFWTWLWGPLGLVLATPLTVCAAVVGRHVPQLSFLSVALGDEPVLNAEVEFYQRTLAKASKDAYRLVRRRALATSLPDTFDELFLPALGLMVSEQNLQGLAQGTSERLVRDINDIVDRLVADEGLKAALATNAKATALDDLARTREDAAGDRRGTIVAIPAESESDVLLVRMLTMTLGEDLPRVVPLPRAGRAKLLADAIQHQPSAICIAALPPSGNANARFLCRRLRAELPDVRLIVLLPEARNKRSREAAARLREAGASAVVYGLREAARLLIDPAATSQRGGRSVSTPELAVASTRS
ncbi:MAG TPA: AI-2E family transporter [Polyangiaceae bacterium]|nr:AI-2E family transporter [Polyangiaceae bacterium]